MKLKPIKYLISLIFLIGISSASAQVTLTTELRHFAISDLPSYRNNTVVKEESTYDRTGGNDDGFNGTYSFVRRNSDSSLVLLDIAGPGEINRFATPTPTSDTLDFYIDNDNKPTLSICYMDLFSGKVYPFITQLSASGAGGYYTYFPILFRKHCKIVSRGKQEQFHQIQYRLFSPGTKVQGFTGKLNSAEQQELDEISNDWKISLSERLYGLPAKQISYSGTIAPGHSVTAINISHGGRILGLNLSGDVKNLKIRISWDNGTPAVDCPATDFFGFAFGKPSMKGLLVGCTDDTCYSFLPMAFDKKATIELVNTSDTPATISLNAYINNKARNPQTEGRFYVQWKTGETTDGEFWQLAAIKGKGHYVGTVLLGQGVQPGGTSFWEGDDITTADGEMTIHGTGTEDYFNGGWYDLPGRWDGPQSFPLCGCLDYSRKLGRTGGYRFYLNDKLPFNQGLLETIEHGPEDNDVPANYTSVAYYYRSQP